MAKIPTKGRKFIPGLPIPDMEWAEPVRAPPPKYEMQITVGRWHMVNGNPAIVFKAHTINHLPDIAYEIGKALQDNVGSHSVAVVECHNILHDSDGAIRSILQWRFEMS